MNAAVDRRDSGVPGPEADNRLTARNGYAHLGSGPGRRGLSEETAQLIDDSGLVVEPSRSVELKGGRGSGDAVPGGQEAVRSIAIGHTVDGG
jgi:hypothetical protein